MRLAAIVALIPLALNGVKFRSSGAAETLARNLAVYGVGGILGPFLGIKMIDVIITTIGLVR
jgi:K+-transporting ATPase ATPase B chain